MPIRLRENDPHGRQKKEFFDKALVLAGGSYTRLSKLLGLTTSSMQASSLTGQLSALGAVMAARSDMLGRVFKSSDFRPDLTPEDFLGVAASNNYQKAAEAQDRYQSTDEFKQHNVVALVRGLGDESIN